MEIGREEGKNSASVPKRFENESGDESPHSKEEHAA